MTFEFLVHDCAAFALSLCHICDETVEIHVLQKECDCAPLINGRTVKHMMPFDVSPVRQQIGKDDILSGTHNVSWTVL